MSKSNTLPISEARRKIFDIAEDVQRPNRHYTLTDRGRPKAVVLSADEYDSLIETLDILSDPDALERIKKAEAEYAKGEYKNWKQVKKEVGYKLTIGNIITDQNRKKQSKK